MWVIFPVNCQKRDNSALATSDVSISIELQPVRISIY